MDLVFKKVLANQYKSASQRIRILSEGWVKREVYCPNCGNSSLQQYINNKPVADFFCQNCSEDFELKSKKNSIGKKILDGSYESMLARITGLNNPNFFLLNYEVQTYKVFNLLIIPKHFFIPEIIEKRLPLSANARRAGYVGCNILLHKIPQSGRIFLIKNGSVEPKRKVINIWNKTLFLREKEDGKMKGWILDIMNCIDRLEKKEFRLEDVYAFESELLKKHPENKHVKDKIRQQLQLLRDKRYLEFLGAGKYRIL